MKYSMNKKLLYGFLLVGLIASSSCKKSFLDVNDDPNRVTDSNITPELIFTGAEVRTGDRAAAWNFLQNWMGYLAAAGDYAIVQEETSYNIDFGFGEGVWQGHYDRLYDLELVRVNALAKGDTVLSAAATILQAKLWGELVDVFGNIPYTQAFKTNETRTPKYDDAKTVIYPAIIASLDKAVGYMGKTAKSSFAGIDVIAKGNRTTWIKLANTLKLRLLLRVNNVAGFNASAEAAMINGLLIGAGETVSVNPGYVNDVNKQSPFYGTYGYTSANPPADASPPVRANQYFVNLLKGTGDPRLTRFYSPVSGNVVGNVYGLAAGNPIGTASSKFGPA